MQTEEVGCKKYVVGCEKMFCTENNSSIKSAENAAPSVPHDLKNLVMTEGEDTEQYGDTVVAHCDTPAALLFSSAIVISPGLGSLLARLYRRSCTVSRGV